MSIDWGNVPVGAVIPFPFDTFAASTGAPITMSGLAVTDIEVYKGTSMTQRASDNGFALMDTDGIDIDSRTGIHGFSIDTSDNTDSGFYAAGSFYWVVVDAITVDSQTLRFIAGTFRLVAAESSAGVPKVDLSHISGSSVSTSSAQVGVNVVNAGGTAWGSGAITAASIASDAITAAKIANGAIDAATFAADVDAEILSYLVDDATRIDASALNTATGTTIPAILTDTAEIGAAGAGLTEAGGTGDQLTAVPWNAAWDAEVESEATDALNAYDPPTRAELTSDTNSILSKLLKYFQLALRKDSAIATDNGTEVTAINADGGSGAGAFANTTDSQEALRDRGDAAWVTATGFSTLDAAGVRSAVGLASANLDTQLGALPTAAENADAVWEEALADHEGTAGSTAEALASAGGSGASAADIADAVLDEALSGHTTGGTLGKAVADILEDTGTTLQGELDGIQADTEDIQTRLPAALTANGNMKSSLLEIISTALSEGATGRLAAAWQNAWNVAFSAWTSASVNQTGDSYARLGAPAGASVSADVAAVKSQTAAIETDTQDIQTKIGTPAGASVSADIAAIEAQTDDIGTAGAGLTSIPWNAAWDAEVQSEVADALAAYDPPTKAELDSAVAPLALEATAQEILTDTGTSIPSSLSTIAGYLDTEVAAILADTNELQTDWANGGRLDLLVDAIKAATDNLPSDPADASVVAALIAAVDAKIDIIDGIVDTILVDTASLNDTALADSVPADGALGTVRQTLYELRQFLMERSVSGTTVTTKKVDGSTSLETFTLDDATSPTSITRAT